MFGGGTSFYMPAAPRTFLWRVDTVLGIDKVYMDWVNDQYVKISTGTIFAAAFVK